MPVARRAGRATCVAVGLSLIAAPLGAVPAIADEAAPPVFDGTGSLTGEPAVGSTLTVDLSDGSWSPTPTDYSYVWYASDDDVIDASDVVADATSDSFALLPAHVGDLVAVDVTGSLAGESSTPIHIVAGEVVRPGAFVTAQPTISGSGRVGDPLTASSSPWTPEAELAFEWFVDGASVATGAAYVPVDADLGKAVTVAATGSAAGYQSTTVTSLPVVVGSGLVAGTVTISGTVQVGKTVSAATGSAWPAGSTLAYRWYVGSTPISGATGRTYTIPADKAGKTLKVVVTASRAGYTPVTATSAAKTVAKGVFAAAKPTISGTVRIGATVKANRGTWTPSPSSVTYVWKVNGARVKTGSSYTIPSRHWGKKLTLTVTGSRTGYTTKTVTSSSVVIAKPFATAPRPTVTGTTRVNSTLTARVGSWSPTPSSFSFQWKADGKSIKGATGKSYRLKPADHAKRITVTVTAKRVARVTTSRTSSPTARIAWPVGYTTPKISSSPKSLYVKAGTPVSFKVSATGGGLSYQWQRRGASSTDRWTNISSSSAKTATLRFTATTSHELNRYRVVVKNMIGQKVSSPAMLWVQSSFSQPMPVDHWFQLNYTAVILGKAVPMGDGYVGSPGYACPAYTDRTMQEFTGSFVFSGATRGAPPPSSRGRRTATVAMSS